MEASRSSNPTFLSYIHNTYWDFSSYCTKSFIFIIWLNLANNPKRWIEEKHIETEKLSDLPRVTQLIIVEDEVNSVLGLDLQLWATNLYHLPKAQKRKVACLR